MQIHRLQRYIWHDTFKTIKEELHAFFTNKLVFVLGTEWHDKQKLIACNIDNSPAIRYFFVVMLSQHDCQVRIFSAARNAIMPNERKAVTRKWLVNPIDGFFEIL